jgi:hypothetical protein
MTPFELHSDGRGSRVEYDQELERLLAQFFKKQVPSPWPDFFTPSANPASINSAGWGGRKMALLALAASLLLLIAGQYCVSSFYSPRFHNRLDAGDAHNEATNRTGGFHSQLIRSNEFSGPGDVSVLSGKR